MAKKKWHVRIELAHYDALAAEAARRTEARVKAGLGCGTAISAGEMLNILLEEWIRSQKRAPS